MTRFAILSAAALLAVPAAAQEQPAVAPPPSGVVDQSANPKAFDLARTKVTECAGEKFEFVAGEAPDVTKVTLCSDAGASKHEIVMMLEAAMTKIQAHKALSAAKREEFVSEIQAKVAELRGAAPATAPETAATSVTTAIEPPAKAPVMGDEVSMLPPLPGPKDTPPSASVLPAPKTTSTSVSILPKAPAAASAVKPRLSIECYTPGQIGNGGPCVQLARDTILTVRADANVPAGTALRFLRQGENRGEIAVAQMRKGRSVRLPVPDSVCSGVVTSEVQVQVVGGGQVADSIGPFLIRC